ncbi:hypothetical protein [Cellulomonas sp. Leaf334]|uniref:hypothetical protein n=1 Tax=Cellulomonas sp. Leaf334 TaxID=1736339 RepID=UPI0012E21269|nr:hypothetical protein [Cellulomonas sp. Leaf334]
MTASRKLVEFRDVESLGTAEELIALVDQTASDQGEVRATFRPWPGRTAWGVIVALLVLTGTYTFSAPDTTEMWVRSALLGSLVFWTAVVVAAGAIDRHRVCEHGLVVGFRTRSKYVIPWSTIDPGRVRVVRRPLLLGRREEMPTSSPHYRVGWLSTRAVAVNGLDTAIDGWTRVPGLLGVTDAAELGGRARITPFVWWLLGTQRPRELLEAMEAAMVADSYPAQGMAERALRQTVTLPWRPTPVSPVPPRYAIDPVIGVDGPALP